MEPHPAGPLNDRLDDHRSELIRMQRRELAHRGRPPLIEAVLEAVGGPLGEDVRSESPGEQPVHAVDRVADSHRAKGVAVIAATHGEQAPCAAASPACWACSAS